MNLSEVKCTLVVRGVSAVDVGGYCLMWGVGFMKLGGVVATARILLVAWIRISFCRLR